MTEVLLAGAGASQDVALRRCLERGGLQVCTSPYGPVALAERHAEAGHPVAPCVVFRCAVTAGQPEPRVLDAMRHLRGWGGVGMLVALVDAERRASRSWPAVVAALLEAGADDVVASWADGVEVCARLRALVRRHLVAEGEFARAGGCGGCPGPPPCVDGVRRRLVGRLGSVALTAKEFLVMQTILECEGLARRDRIGERLWCDRRPGSSKAIDMHVSSLRRKLRRVCGTEWCIETVRGVGFVLVDEAASRGQPSVPPVRQGHGEAARLRRGPSTLGG